MADKELYYGQSGSILYDDEGVSWYPVPYDTLPLRAALLSQAYVTDVPVNDIEVARRMDVDGTPGAILKAGANSLPADSVISEDATNIVVTGRNIISDLTGTKNLGSALVLWAGVFSNAFKMPTGAGVGKFIKSDADGNFEWATAVASESDPIFTAWLGTVRAVNTVFAGPATGASAVPTFRSLVAADIPDLSATYLTPGAHTAIGDGSPHHAAITLDTNADTLLSLSTQALGLDTQTANLIFAGPTAAPSAIPTFRALVNADFPAALSPTFAGLTLTGLAGVLKAAAGVIAGSAARADLGSIGENDHHTKFTTVEHLAIGSASPHHAAVALSVAADILLALSTQEIGLDTQAANLLFAGPASGAVATPTFRAMVAADLGTGLTPTFAGIVIGDAGTIGLGSGKGLIQFDDETEDIISFHNCLVSIRTTNPTAPLHVTSTGSENVNIDGQGVQGNLYLRRYNGTATAKTTVVDGDPVGYFQFSGYDGSAFINAGAVGLLANGVQSANNTPSDMLFYLNPGGPNVVEVMRLDKNRNLIIGGTVPNARLSLSGTGRLLSFLGGGTSVQYCELINTGSNFVWGVEGSAGGALYIGAAAYSAVLGTENATALHLGTSNTVRLTIASGGAVTIASLAGTGTRTVVADANGVLSAP